MEVLYNRSRQAQAEQAGGIETGVQFSTMSTLEGDYVAVQSVSTDRSGQLEDRPHIPTFRSQNEGGGNSYHDILGQRHTPENRDTQELPLDLQGAPPSPRSTSPETNEPPTDYAHVVQYNATEPWDENPYDYEARLLSFSGYPGPDTEKRKHALNGFFYEGRGKEVRCHYCGIRYRDPPAEKGVFCHHGRQSSVRV